MKKVLIFLVLMCLVLVLYGCSNSDKPSETPSSEEIESIEEQKEPEIEQEQEESATEETENDSEANGFLKNNTKCFPGSEYIDDVTFGLRNGTDPWPLFSVKLPTDYIFAASSIDETGEPHTYDEIDGVLFNVIKGGGLEQYMPYYAGLTAQGKTDCTYTIEIFESSYISIDTEKEYSPGGTVIKEGDPHEAYAYETDEYKALIIRLNDDWTASISSNGNAMENLPISEWGEELYSLVTPLE